MTGVINLAYRCLMNFPYELSIYLSYYYFFISVSVSGVFGGLDLFGMDVGITWTLLATKGVVGDTHIVLAQQVQWSAGDEIVIGPTGFDPWQTESFEIVSLAADNVTLTLNASLKYLHTGKLVIASLYAGKLCRHKVMSYWP